MPNPIEAGSLSRRQAMLIGLAAIGSTAAYAQTKTPPHVDITVKVTPDNPLIPATAELSVKGKVTGVDAPASKKIKIIAKKHATATTLAESVAVATDGTFTYTYKKDKLDDSAPIEITAQWGDVTSDVKTINYPTAGNAVTIDGKTRKALVVVWDGCRGDTAILPDIAPNLCIYAKQGARTYTSYSGGVKGTPTQTSTVTACGFNNIWTGVFANKHKVVSNGARNPNYKEYPTFFKSLKDLSDKKLYIAGLFGWEVMYTKWLAKEDNFIDYHQATDKIEQKKHGDTTYHQEALDMLANHDGLDLFFYETYEPDGLGHAHGFSPTVKPYTDGVRILDGQLKELVTSIRSRKTFKDESWMLIVSSDHGGIRTSHGGQTREERDVPLIISHITANDATPGDPSIVTAGLVEKGPAHCTVYPTLLHHFGYKKESLADYLEAKPFGVPV